MVMSYNLWLRIFSTKMEIQSYLSNPQGVMILRSVDRQVKICVQEFFWKCILKRTKKLPIDEMQIFAVFILGLSLEDLTRTNLC